MMRKPSCLISCSHCSPEGGCGALMGRHGAMNPAGRARRRDNMDPRIGNRWLAYNRAPLEVLYLMALGPCIGRAFGRKWHGSVEWSSFGDVADPGVWSRIHDEGLQTLENIANIRIPVIAAVEGRAHIHSDYALLADVIVAAEGATFQDVGHFAVGVTPGDGIFTTWSYRAGAGRAEACLLNPQPLSARTAYEWGVVAEVVPNGKTVARARELADLYLRAPEVTRRNTRIHFIQPLKERIVREVGYGLSLEGASSADLAKSKQSKSGAVT